MKRTLLALAATGLLAMAGAANSGTITFTFQPCGNASCAVSGVSKLDWQPGNVLAVGGAGGGTILPTGKTITDYFQANLGTALGTGGVGDVKFANGGGSNYFTVVAGFNEIVSPLSGGATNVFQFAGGSPNFFQVFANTTAPGSDLAGTGFTSSKLVLSGAITSVFSSVTATSVVFTQNGAQIVAGGPLDNFGANNYAGVQTISTIGGADIKAKITFADANYFPDLMIGSSITTALTSSNLGTPYNQTDPSAQFWDGSALIASNIGAINGITGPNFQFQADSSTAFEIPEPGSIALVGAALLGVAGLARRRRAA